VKKAIAVGLISILFVVVPAWSSNSTGTITLSSAYLSFGMQSIGTVSSPQTLTVTKTRDTNLRSPASAQRPDSVWQAQTVQCCSPDSPAMWRWYSCRCEAVNYLSRLNLGTPYSSAAFTAVLYGTGQ
jgi:hypothetical protein